MTDDLYPGPTSEVPTEGRAKEMAAADARDAAQKLREVWGNSAEAAISLTGDYGAKTWFQLRQENSAVPWPEDVRPIYLDAFCDHLAAEKVAYLVTHEGGIAHIVDCERWEHPTLRPGTITRVDNPNAGWTARGD